MLKGNYWCFMEISKHKTKQKSKQTNKNPHPFEMILRQFTQKKRGITRLLWIEPKRIVWGFFYLGKVNTKIYIDLYYWKLDIILFMVKSITGQSQTWKHFVVQDPDRNVATGIRQTSLPLCNSSEIPVCTHC